VVSEIEAGGAGAGFVVGDISTLGNASRLVEAAVERFGHLDILVNNAGISFGRGKNTWDSPEDDFDRLLRVNLRSVYVCSKAAIPSMLSSGGGAIVNVASIAVFAAVGGAPYGAAKGGVVSYSKHLAIELATRNIRVNCVFPGFMWTPMSTGEREGATPAQQAERKSMFASYNPMGRVGSADDIANAILFLASDEAGYITGQEIIVDGGFQCRT
jgi:NAD(P)-dependent dehydrogenase (short-subunit alcohol dehydrogenase family)